MTEYTELKRLAESATAGPWKTNTAGSAKRGEPYKITEIYVYAPDTQDDTAICADVIDPVTQEPSEVNAAYIASASPDVVLSMIAEIERHRCGAEVLQRLHDEDMAERDKLHTQNQALLEALKGLQKQYAEHPDAFWDWSQARAAIKLAEGEDV